MISRGVLAVLFLVSAVAAARPIAERVDSASNVIVNRMTSQYPIPSGIVDRAKCVASLKVVKAGLIWGGQGSTGMVTCRTANHTWSAPSFFSVDGVNFGIQIGVQFLESVLLFVTDFSREILQHPTFQVGTDLSFAAGPVGEGAGEGQMPDAHILSYQRSFGLYAGATINGFVLAHSPRLNREAYQSDVTPSDLLEMEGTQAPAVVQPFLRTMSRYLPAK